MKNNRLYSRSFSSSFRSSANLFIIFFLINNHIYFIESTDLKTEQLSSASNSITQLDSPVVSNFFHFDNQNNPSKRMNRDENQSFTKVFNFIDKQPTSLNVIRNDDVEIIRSNIGRSNRKYIKPSSYRRREDRTDDEENAEKDKYEEDEPNNDKPNRRYNSKANKESDGEANEPNYETENDANSESGSTYSNNDANDENRNDKQPDYNDVNYDEQKNQRKLEQEEARANKVGYDSKEDDNLIADEENSIKNEEDDKLNNEEFKDVESFKNDKNKLMETNENNRKLGEENQPIDLRFSPLQTYSRQFTPKPPKFFSFFSSFDNLSNPSNTGRENIKESLKEDEDEEFLRDDPVDNSKEMSYNVFDMDKKKSERLDKTKSDDASKFNKLNKSTKKTKDGEEKSKKDASKFMNKKKEKTEEKEKKDDEKNEKKKADKYNKETKEPKDLLIDKEDNTPDILGDGSKFEKNEELLIELLKKRVLSNHQRLLQIKKQEQRKQFQNEIDESFYLRKINQEVQKYAEIENKLNRLINLIQNQQKLKNLNRISNYPSTRDIYHSLDNSFGDSFDSSFGLNNQGNLQTLEQKFFEQKLMPNDKKNRSRPLSLFGSNNFHLYPPNRFSFYRPMNKPLSNHLTSNHLSSNHLTNNLNGWFNQLASNNKSPQQNQASLPRHHYSNLNYAGISSTDYPMVKRYPIFKKIKSSDETATLKPAVNSFNNLASNLFGTRQTGSVNLIQSILQPTTDNNFRNLSPIKYQYRLLKNLQQSIPLRMYTNERSSKRRKVIRLPEFDGIQFAGSGYSSQKP